MRALPAASRDSTEPQVIGLACPECPGVIDVQSLHPGGALLFRCRIGHAFDEEELLAAKEQRLETHLWAAVTAFEELAMLLHDLGRDAGRRAQALAGATAVRQLIESDRPLCFDHSTHDLADGEVR